MNNSSNVKGAEASIKLDLPARSTMKECLNYKKINSSMLECFTCSHFCKIKEGRVGICGIRQNLDGKLYLVTYGRAAAVNIDPIEKKPLFHFLPGSFSYSFGTLGCNFRCGNCQNYDISQMFGTKGRVEEYGKLSWGIEAPPKVIVEEAVKNGCKSISYTYNEPTIFLEYALDTMKLAKEKGLKNVWVSNGFMTRETLDVVIPYLDAINVDIKSWDNNFYKSNCGAKIRPVLENCKRLVKDKVWLEVTTLVIPFLSDDEKVLENIAGFIKKELGDFVPWHVSAFSGVISWKLQHLPATPVEKIKKAYDIGKETGLKYVYAGNIWESDLESTYCPKCKKVFIPRFGYEVGKPEAGAKCKYCGNEIEGVYG